MNNDQIINILFSVSVIYMSWFVLAILYAVFVKFRYHKEYKKELKEWEARMAIKRKQPRRIVGGGSSYLFQDSCPEKKKYHVIVYDFEIFFALICTGFWIYLLVY